MPITNVLLLILLANQYLILRSITNKKPYLWLSAICLVLAGAVFFV